MDEMALENPMLQKLSAIGQMQLKKGNLRKAKAAFEYMYKKARVIDSKVYQEASLVNMAATYIDAKKPEKAINCLKAALALSVPNANYADIHYNLAIAHEMLDNQKEASKEYDLALLLYSQSDLSSSEIVANTGIKAGILHMKLGDYRRANECLDISTPKLSEKSLIVQLATVLCLKAQCLVKSNNTVTEAVQVGEECLKLCRTLTQDAFVVNLCNELGLVFTQSKQYETSAECYKLGLSVMENLRDSPVPQTKKAALLQNLGAVLNSTGHFEQAVEYSARAAEIYGVFGIRSSQCHCFLNMAFSYSRLKTPGAGEKCEEYYLHAYQAAKDTECIRDQWQACEGLAGVSLYKGLIGKAIDYYQKAVGLCAATVSKTPEQDRLVKKLSAVIRLQPSAAVSSANQNIYVPTNQLAPSLFNHSPSAPLIAEYSTLNQMYSNRPTSSTYSPHVQMQNLVEMRAANPNASRVPLVNVNMPADEDETTSVPARRKRKRKRLRRRVEHEELTSYEPVHHGLGTYNSVVDETYSQHLLPQHIVNKGRRRHHDVEDGSSVVSGLKIKGLAVTLDEPIEQRLSSSKGNHFDQLDASDVVEVRPMSRQLKHRRSRLDFESDLERVERDFDSESIDESQTRNVDSDPESTESVEEEAVDNNRRATENGLYGSIVKGVDTIAKTDADQVPQRSQTPSKGKGKRPMSATNGSFYKVNQNNSRALLDADQSERNSSAESDISEGGKTREDIAETGSFEVPAYTRFKKTVRLDVEEEDNFYDTGAQNLKDYERKLIRLESSDVETDDEIKTDIASGEDNSSPDSTDDDDGERIPRQTYEKPVGVDPAQGVNFFKSTDPDPLYATINAATTSVPQHQAPPKLPRRNYGGESSKATEDSATECDSADDDSSTDIGEMSRGERERYLFEKHKVKPNKEKVVRWKKDKNEKKQRSRACNLM